MKYFLFGNNQVLGPIDSMQLETLKNSKKIDQYQWIIDDQSQIWSVISAEPTENPFQASNDHIKNRRISVAFKIGKKTYLGKVIQMHSFGAHILIENQHQCIRNLNSDKIIFINICDETNFIFMNKSSIIESQTLLNDSLNLQFNWKTTGAIL